MEKRKIAPILATVFSRDNMRFVYNTAESCNLAAYHGIYPFFKDVAKIKSLLCYLNSNICKEIQKVKRREYGGGLHKFEPSDLDKLPVLDITNISSKDINALASLFDELCSVTNENKEKILEKIDVKILKIIDQISD